MYNLGNTYNDYTRVCCAISYRLDVGFRVALMEHQMEKNLQNGAESELKLESGGVATT